MVLGARSRREMLLKERQQEEVRQRLYGGDEQYHFTSCMVHFLLL